MELTEALRTIKEQSNLTELEWDDLVQVVLSRANGTPLRHSDVIGESPTATDLPKIGAWVDRAELATILGVPKDHVYKWFSRGRLPEPDEYVSGRPCWARKTVRQLGMDLVALAN